MYKLILVILLFSSAHIGLYSQVSFTEIYTNIQTLSKSACAWGDYDNDNDLDLLITGAKSSNEGDFFAAVYRNDGNGVFTNINAELTGVYDGDAGWSDLDRDGDLDFVYSGVFYYHFPAATTVMKTFIYRNNGDSTFSLTQTLDDYGSTSIGDYNNDFLPDIFGTGCVYYNIINDAQTIVSYADIFSNNGNCTFTKLNVSLPTGALDCCDYNKDGYADLISSRYQTEILINDKNGNFVSSGISFPFGAQNSYDIADYDDDGDEDFAFAGNNVTKIYKNTNGMFTEIATELEGMSDDYSYCRWGDINNDGKNDLLISGYSLLENDWATKIYLNKGNDVFQLVPEKGSPFRLVGLYKVFLGDYDSENDLDVLCIGNGNENITRLFKNTGSLNLKPEVPTNLDMMSELGYFTLTWDPAIDDRTPQSGLSYNIYLSTSPTLINLLSPMSSITNGYKRTVSTGNAKECTSVTINGLPEGIYYWSVQAVDNSMAGSGFAPMQSILVNNSPQNVTILTSGTEIKLTWTEVNGAASYKIFESDDPYGIYKDVSDLGTFAGTSWTASGLDMKKFYYVVAAAE
ncbi:MAG: FG-GAP-like repeat-containing protein [Candidatus Delongbacteria bacterium]